MPIISKKSVIEIKNDKGEVIGRIGSLKEEKKNMKICFYYNNGRTYTATGITTYHDYQDHVYYNQEKDTGLLKIDSDIEVSKSDLLAYVVYDGNSTTIVKVGNCKLNFDSEGVNNTTFKQNKKKSTPTENGWIGWKGGQCPVAEGTLVDVMYSDGWIEKQIPALLVHGREGRRIATNWSLRNSDSAIVAYRLSKGE